jgi:cytochrome c-type biogenesis protein CcmH
VIRTLVLAAALAMPLAGGAKDAVPTAQDPVAAARAVDLAAQLRCLVCQNQSIAESNAELAVDLRRQIDQQIAAGRSDREILDFMTERYGDFVLYRPPFNAATALLWLGPALLLVLGFFVLRRVLRDRTRAAVDRPLTDEERKRAEALLAGEAGERPR